MAKGVNSRNYHRQLDKIGKIEIIFKIYRFALIFTYEIISGLD